MPQHYVAGDAEQWHDHSRDIERDKRLRHSRVRQQSGRRSPINPASGVVAAGGTQSLSLGWSNYTTTGPLTGTVTLSNTTNSRDPFNTSGNVITMTGAVVDNRVVTSTSASFGLVHVGAAISQGITLSTTGDDNYYTRVTVANGGIDNNGFFTVSGGSNPTFNSAR